MELFVMLRVFCNPETQFSQHRERAGTQSGDCGCTVVTLLSLHAQSLCRATQSGRDRAQSGFWRWFRATQSGFSVTVRDLALSLHHTVRLCRTQSVDCRATQSDCVGHSRSSPSDCVGTQPQRLVIKHAATSRRVQQVSSIPAPLNIERNTRPQ